MGIGDWGLGIGDWGLGIGPNPQSPIPNPQSPIPNPQFNIKFLLRKLKKRFHIILKNVYELNFIFTLLNINISFNYKLL